MARAYWKGYLTFKFEVGRKGRGREVQAVEVFWPYSQVNAYFLGRQIRRQWQVCRAVARGLLGKPV
jgi:hypothetical protein